MKPAGGCVMNVAQNGILLKRTLNVPDVAKCSGIPPAYGAEADAAK